MKKIRWGIVGTGFIARTFADDMAYVKDSEITAVCSRRMESGERFASGYRNVRVYDDMTAFLGDSDIDAVYIATPHPAHKSQSVAALEAGKAVLCEKPITMNLEETKELVNCARVNGILLMEAMWTKFLPAIVKVKSMIEEGIIGEIRLVTADFGYNAGSDYPVTGRVLNPELGGGARLDVGIYPITFAQHIIGKTPLKIQASQIKASTGVDALSSYVFTYDNAIALLHSAVTAQTPQVAYISGEKGTITIPDFWKANSFTLNLSGQEPQRFVFEREHKGYVYEIEAFNDSLREGLSEVPALPLDETLKIMEIMDICSNI